ncbi:MAG: alpha/beta fold hydrolase [Solirubrobacterales bacterium]
MSRILEFSRAGLTFDVIDGGPEDGDPVVLLHGCPERAGAWSDVAEQLHAEGLRTYAPDQRGYAPRARPKSRFNYRPGQLGDDVAELINQIGRPVHLVGHDWGAAVAWVVACRHAASVRTLTAASVPHPTAFLLAMFTSDQLIRSYYMGLWQLPWLPERIMSDPQRSRRFLKGMTDAELETFDRDIVGHGAIGPAINWYRSMMLSSPLPKCEVPTTHVWGAQDPFLGRTGAESCGKYVAADYRLDVIEDGNHWLPTQQPTRLSRSILERVNSL